MIDLILPTHRLLAENTAFLLQSDHVQKTHEFILSTKDFFMAPVRGRGVSRYAFAPMPQGPWLSIIGMHRSGTSAITGAMGALGFNLPLPELGFANGSGNPEHYESRPIANFNDQLLHRFGGNWYNLPDFPAGWEESTLANKYMHPGQVTVSSYPHPGPIVWKDPRSCIVFNYWRRFIPGPHVAILIWRWPLAVAKSLVARGNGDLKNGIALWEQYNRAALENLHGVQSYVISYEVLLSNPAVVIRDIVEWLAAMPQFSQYKDFWNPQAAIDLINANDNHSGGPRIFGEIGDIFNRSQLELAERLHNLQGPHLSI